MDELVERLMAERLILALGVIDELPDVPGVAERWGQSIFHCARAGIGAHRSLILR